MRATSHAAAATIDRNTLKAEVLEGIKRQGRHGMTDDECQLGLAMNPSTQRPRRIELERAGLVVDSGTVRKTRSGRNAVVWVAAEYGPKAAVKQMEFEL